MYVVFLNEGANNFVKPLQVGSAAALFAFTFFSVMLNLSGPGWLGWYEMSEKGQKIEATITQIQPENHQRCYFRYSIAGRNLDGTGDGCADLGVNGKLLVIYLPGDPKFVTTRNPNEELALTIIVPLLFSIIAGVIVALRQFRKIDVHPIRY
ncbi:hypothetical protein QN372_15305 [Undibacterium sp. RTI2.1]|uniref:hypothetical protein n=1 Tax=unclassified Undibacterium TaxID=2630295 RepID=UPI002B23646B|nr:MULTISPECIES: hypothetical protein [unclassified Undibacterium]MEB0032127.1 hypothetical protein [Undibacterium sp. RTI2.1]